MKKIILTSFIIFCAVFSFAYLSTLAYAYDSIVVSSYNTQLSQEEARELLLKYNSKVDYIYKGDTSQYPALNEKKLEGYVFLPNVPTDIGYFVDKNNGDIYFFHPSGYLEKIPFKN